ncbi:MAG TPA: hypothetical protein VKV17_20415 [Bryobacteraceae bacterium]|nr:hypothetical protein [Bryobacteraceae bacterium]
MLRRSLWLLAAAACAAFAQKYDGPRPPKPDIPYIKHADHLIPTEVVQAKEDKRKEETLYTIDGESSSARTPLAEPIFLLAADKLNPDKLQLYRLETKNGHREILFGKKKGPMPIRVEVTRLSSDNLYKLEVDEELMPGEYSLSPEGSNQVFCFQVF